MREKKVNNVVIRIALAFTSFGIALSLKPANLCAEQSVLEQLQGAWIMEELLRTSTAQNYQTPVSTTASSELASFYITLYDRNENIWRFGAPQADINFNIAKAETAEKEPDTITIYSRDANGQFQSETFKILERKDSKITRLSRLVKTHAEDREMVYVPISDKLLEAVLPMAEATVSAIIRPIMGDWVRKDLAADIKNRKSIYKTEPNERLEAVFQILEPEASYSPPYAFFNWFHEASYLPIINAKTNKNGTEYILIYPHGREILTVSKTKTPKSMSFFEHSVIEIKRRIEWGSNYGLEATYIRFSNETQSYQNSQRWKSYLNRLIFGTQCDEYNWCSGAYQDEFGQLYIFQNETVQMPEGVFKYTVEDDFVFAKDADYLRLENHQLPHRTETSDFAPDQCGYAAFEYKNGKFLLYRTTYIEPNCEKRELFRTLTPVTVDSKK